jgi:hypothetical protein
MLKNPANWLFLAGSILLMIGTIVNMARSQ